MAKKDNTLPVLAHVLGLVSGFLGPLILLMVSKEKYVQKHVKIVLNWQFSLMIYMFASALLIFIFLGFLLIPTLTILNIIFSILGVIKASEGKLWRYPLSIKFFKVQ